MSVGRALFWVSIATLAGPALAQHSQGTPAFAPPPPLAVAATSAGIESAAHHGMTLAEFESLALANNPTLVQANAQVRAARGAAYQAGLYINPEVGYTGEQIGIEGTVGEMQGGFISQEIVTGGKLRLSRAKWAQRARIAAANASIQCARVLNDVRVLFYRTLAAARLVAIQQELLENAQDDVQTHREMLNLGQTNPAGLLQAEVALQRRKLGLREAENDLEEHWRALVAMAGFPCLERTPLNGSLKLSEPPLAWESALSSLLANSPELAAAWEEIRHDEITVKRERVQPIPNITVSAAAGRNFETNDTVAGVTAGIPLPIFDRNRGTVQQALADLSQARANVKRLELDLTTRLAGHFRGYQTAWQHVQAFESEMLPKSRLAYEQMRKSYSERRAPWPDVLTTHRMYLELQSEYVRRLLSYREMDVAIRGMLLTGGLDTPPAPLSGGHIDSVSKPR